MSCQAPLEKGRQPTPKEKARLGARLALCLLLLGALITPLWIIGGLFAFFKLATWLAAGN